MDDNREIIIYFENGQTKHFNYVTEFEINENNTLNFNHFDGQSQKKSLAVFSFDIIAGFSIHDE